MAYSDQPMSDYIADFEEVFNRLAGMEAEVPDVEPWLSIVQGHNNVAWLWKVGLRSMSGKKGKG